MAVVLTIQGASLALSSPYDPGFVAALHAAVPYDKHKWRKPYWLIDPAYGSTVADLCYDFYGVRPNVPRIHNHAQVETRAIRLEYLGRCKVRDGSQSGPQAAYGFADGAWSVIIPESILRAWFHAPAASEATQDAPSRAKQRPPDTPYAVLGVAQDVDASALKKARNRLALQWHPDRCHEPNAADMFRQIQEAYDLLSDPVKRKRYDAGLKLKATLAPTPAKPASRPRIDPDALTSADPYGYRAPLRCGLIVAEGINQLGRFVVSTILSWDDIKDSRGRTMVSSWPQGADTFEVDWVYDDAL